MSAYNICKLLISLSRTAGLQAKVNMFYACGQLTDDQYAELTNTLTPAAADSGSTSSTATDSSGSTTPAQ